MELDVNTALALQQRQLQLELLPTVRDLTTTLRSYNIASFLDVASSLVPRLAEELEVQSGSCLVTASSPLSQTADHTAASIAICHSCRKSSST